MANFGPSLEEVDSITDDVAYAEPATACEDVVNAGQLNGQIALIDRGDCTFVTKVRNAQQAGAVAVIIVDDGRGLVGMADDGSGSDITIPSVMVSQGDGARIKGALPGVRVTLRSDIEVQRSDLTDQISSFSSRGPGWRRSTGEVSPDDSPLIFKPEVTAPGSNILSAKWASGTQGVSFSGTSMAAPHVAGVAALVKRAHPGWEPGQIKSALLTTARPEIYVDGNPAFGGGGTLAPATRMGAGLVDALAAINSDVFIFGGEGSAVDFGFQVASEPTTLTREVTLRNDGDSDGTYEIDFAFLDADDADAGVSIHASSEQITVPAGGSATVEITADIDPAILKAWSLRGSATGSSEALRDIEYDGWLTFTPVGTAVDQPARGLHVPVYLLVRRSADIAVEPSSVSVEDFGVDHSASLQLTNVSPVAGVAEVFTLVGQDVDEGGTSGAVDVRAAGVRSTAVAGLGNVLEFAFATHAPRVHPAQIELDVFIDVDRDGTADYVLFNGDLGILSGQQASGVNVTVLFDRETNEASLEFYTDTDLLTTNINLPVVAEHMGLGDDDLAFDFWVSAFDNLSGYLTDVVPERAFETPARFTFDGARPLYVIDRPSVDVVDAQRIEFFVDPRGALAQPSAAGLLILYDSSITNVAWDAVEVDFEYELHDLAITAGEAVTGFVYSSDVNGASLGGSPMWTGRTDKDVRWYGVTQFDLASQLPDNAHALKASLGLTGLEARYLDDEADASWVVELLDTSIDSIWPAVTYYAVDRADVAAQLGPVARDEELVEGEVNVFQFDPDQVSLLSQRAATTGRVSLRTNMALDRLSQFVARHLFAWDGGRGTSVSSERPPVLHIKYVVAKR
ncbi:MAG: Minor extracellular protease vpr [Anaerolineales bacterium]|nr:Minor extracellular protease vpr [Anaerolineales bacterium]